MKARFGRYVFLKKLADGGMAEIFLARRLSFGGFAKFVVIKRLLPEYRGHRTYEKLFLAEARTGALLNHPNIVSLHDLGSLDDAYFIAMEYVDGLSGAELMNWAQYRKRPLPIGVALRQVVGVAEALEYCSSAPDLDGNPLQVIHHDISPHNVQISFEGAVKLLDFGVATRQGAHAPGGRRGKFAYMSPEAIAKQPLDHRSDLYSLGVVLYELTTGRRLFKGKDAAETRALATQGEITRPTTVDAYYPESLEEVVLKALARDKDERFQHARDLARSLREVGRRIGADMTAGALARYMAELMGDTLGERRAELARLARAADTGAAVPDSKQEPPEAPLPPQETEPAPEMAAALAMLEGSRSGVERSGVERSGVERSGVEPAAQPGPAPEAPAPSGPAPEPPAAPQPAAAEPEPSGRAPEAPAEADPSRARPPQGEPATPDTSQPEPARSAPPMKQPASPDDPGRGGSGRTATVALVAALLAGGAAWFAARANPPAPPEPPAPTARLQIETTPSGARVHDGDTLLGVTPLETDRVSLGQTVSLRVTAPGHDAWRRTVAFDADHPARSFDITLRPTPAQAPVGAAGAEGGSGGSGGARGGSAGAGGDNEPGGAEGSGGGEAADTATGGEAGDAG